MRHSIAKLALLIMLAAVSASAQNWTKVKALAIGQEIRTSLADGKSYRGQVQSVTDESLIIITANSQQTLARAQILKLSTKGDSHRLRNTMIGLAAGAGTGLIMGAVSDHQCAALGCFFDNNFGKEVLTPFGAVVGTIIGVAWPTGRWHEVYRSK